MESRPVEGYQNVSCTLVLYSPKDTEIYFQEEKKKKKKTEYNISPAAAALHANPKHSEIRGATSISDAFISYQKVCFMICF